MCVSLCFVKPQYNSAVYFASPPSLILFLYMETAFWYSCALSVSFYGIIKASYTIFDAIR